jgi:hypothetical protein
MTTLQLPSFSNPFAFLFNGSNSTQQNPAPTNATPSTPSANINLGNLKISAEEQELLLRLIDKEARGEGLTGMSAVAKSILNRYALVQSGTVKPGAFGATGTSLEAIIKAQGQYEPFGTGKLNKPLSPAEQAKATEALNLALNPEEFTKQLQASGKSASEIKSIERSTGFRAKGARPDSSQTGPDKNNVALGNHTFNTAGNTQLLAFDHGKLLLANA